MFAILDTNCFRGDVYAERPLLSDFFARAQRADMRIIVPQTVVDELVRQFPERLHQVVRTVNRALADSYRELNALRVDAPARIDVDLEVSVDGYAARLTNRLAEVGASVADYPRDAHLALGWAATRRKPFKESGLGLPDAAIWLTAIQCAEADEVLLVTANTSDFADPGDATRPAPALEEDLEQRGAGGRVRIVPSVQSVVEELTRDEERVRARAQALLDDRATGGALIRAIEEALNSRSVPRDELELGVDLDDDAYIEGYDVRGISIARATPLSEGALLLDLDVDVTALLSFMLFKADAYGLPDESPISVANWDWNEWYSEGEIDGVDLRLSVAAIYSDGEPAWAVEIDAITVDWPTHR